MEHWVEMITDQDMKRILAFLRSDALDMKTLDLWDEKIERCKIISQEQTPPDLVTIHSKIHCTEDLDQKSELDKIGHLIVVFPYEANIDEGKISILAPLGIALLGVRVGHAITWQSRDGRARNLLIDSLSYQPEASGHWHL